MDESKLGDIYQEPLKELEERVSEPDLLVRRSDEDVVHFDPQMIVDALVREAGLDIELASRISLEIKQLVRRSGVRSLSSSLIRELVDTKLIEHGLEQARRAHSRLGVPLYDVDRLVHNARRDGSTQPLGPEGTSLVLAEAIKREYAILSVFSEPIAHAHMSGDIQIQDIGAIDRPRSVVQTLDWIKRHSISLPQGFSTSKPARRPEVLIAHLVKFSAALQGYLAGPIIWDSLNFGLAPFVEGMSDAELRQLAQHLIFEFSAPAVARGGQMMSCKLHLDWNAPIHLEGRRAMGPGGQELDRTYSQFSNEAQRFLRALFEVYLEGDGRGMPFITPQPILHITNHFTEAPGYKGLLDLCSQLATEKGTLTFAFDRTDEWNFFQRYGVSLRESERSESWQLRSCIFQAVALNLPRVFYRADGDRLKVFESLTHLMELAAQAHLEKRVFLEKLLALGEMGPLAMIAMRRSGSPFMRLNWTTHFICPVGLNEMVRAATGCDIHQSEEALEMAERIVAHLESEALRLTAKHKARFVLAESAAETTPYRFARLDARFFGEKATGSFNGNVDSGEIYYTQSIGLPPAASVPPFDRALLEGKLQSHGILDCATKIWLSEQSPAREELAVLISRAFYQTSANQLVVAPEFTICLSCHQTTRGLHDKCPSCNSNKVDGLAQATDHLSRTSGWDRGKLAELRDRYRTARLL